MKTKYCKCGCGNVIIPKPYHRWKPAKFISGHNSIKNPQTGVLPPNPTLNLGYQYFIRNGKRVYLQRAIMEEKLGRKFLSHERVHHINGIKTDNRVENLVVLTINEHQRLHANMRKRDENGRNFI